jgi:hypothetical protein
MPRSSHAVVGAMLITAALLPRSGNTADAAHPLESGAIPGVLATENPFDGHVPLLNREDPAPSFASEEAAEELAGDHPEGRPIPALHRTEEPHRGHAAAPTQ